MGGEWQQNMLPDAQRVGPAPTTIPLQSVGQTEEEIEGPWGRMGSLLVMFPKGVGGRYPGSRQEL